MKKAISALLCAVMTVLALSPRVVAASEVSYSDTFVQKNSVNIGWDAFRIGVDEGAAFILPNDQGARTVQVMETSGGRIFEADGIYPVANGEFEHGVFDLSFSAFALARQVGDDKLVLVYIRLNASNTGAADEAVPSVSPELIPLSALPASAAHGESVSGDYALVCSFTGASSPDSAVIAAMGGYDSAETEMHAHWDALLASGFRAETLPDGCEDYITQYSKYVIAKAIGSAETDTPSYDLACNIISGKSRDFAVVTAMTSIQSVSEKTVQISVTGTDGTALLVSSDKSNLSLYENLNALLDLKGAVYLLSSDGVPTDGGEESAENVNTDAAQALSLARELYDRLSTSVEIVLKATESETAAYFGCSVLDGGVSRGLFTLTGSDYRYLADWYCKTGVLLTPTDNAYLLSCGSKAAVYAAGGEKNTDAFFSEGALKSSLAVLKQDGSLSIGRLMPSCWLAEGRTSVRGIRLPGGASASADIEAEGDNITVSITGAGEIPVLIEFPLLRDNIDYASCGFDSAGGTVSLPAGVSQVKIRLKNSAASASETAAAFISLESALDSAALVNTEGSTAYSLNQFETAGDNAKTARNGTAADMMDAAAALRDAAERLSPRLSYTPVGIGENEAPVGKLTGEKIYQPLGAGADGTVGTLRLKGEYAEGVYALLYTLRDDGYTPKELVARAEAEDAGDGTLSFAFSEKTENDQSYCLCVCAPDGQTVSLSVARVPDGSSGEVYTRVSDSKTTVYREAALILSGIISQADMTEMDEFMTGCMEKDLTGYTRESVNRLSKAMNRAGDLLCSKGVSQEECSDVYNALCTAYDSLATYASDEPVKETPAMLYVVLGISAALLICGGTAAVLRRRKET